MKTQRYHSPVCRYPIADWWYPEPGIFRDIADVAGAYMALVMMPLAYSIATGIMFAILTWVIIKTVEGKAKEISPVMWVVFVLFALRIVSLVTNFQ